MWEESVSFPVLCRQSHSNVNRNAELYKMYRSCKILCVQLAEFRLDVPVNFLREKAFSNRKIEHRESCVTAVQLIHVDVHSLILCKYM